MSSITNPRMNGQSPRTLTVIFHTSEEGGIVAECIELPGCFSQGETQEEAERNIREAIRPDLVMV